MLETNDFAMLEQCLWFIANITGESKKLRDYVLQRVDIYKTLLRIVNTSKINRSLLRTVCWLNSNI